MEERAGGAAPSAGGCCDLDKLEAAATWTRGVAAWEGKREEVGLLHGGGGGGCSKEVEEVAASKGWRRQLALGQRAPPQEP